MNEPADDYRVAPECPGVDDYLRLRAAGGLSPFSREAATRGLAGTLFAVTVRHCDAVVGMGRIVGDGGCFFQIVDIVVAPAHQRRGLAHRIMAALTAYLDDHAPPSAYVSLLADTPADRLYARHGFQPTAPKTIGMARRRS